MARHADGAVLWSLASFTWQSFMGSLAAGHCPTFSASIRNLSRTSFYIYDVYIYRGIDIDVVYG